MAAQPTVICTYNCRRYRGVRVGALGLGLSGLHAQNKLKTSRMRSMLLFMLLSLGTWARGMRTMWTLCVCGAVGGGRWLKNNSWNSHGGKLYSITTCEHTTNSEQLKVAPSFGHVRKLWLLQLRLPLSVPLSQVDAKHLGGSVTPHLWHLGFACSLRVARELVEFEYIAWARLSH